MRKNMLTLVFILVAIFSATLSFGQVAPPPPNPPLGIPVDTNAIIVALMGVALFAYTTYRKNQQAAIAE